MDERRVAGGTILAPVTRRRPGVGVGGGGVAVTAPARLRGSDDVRAVLRAGRRASGRSAVVHVRWRDDDAPSRVTVVAGRRLGGAVVRNRAKRRLRAALADVRLEPGHDAVVVARPGVLVASYEGLCRELQGLLTRSEATP